MNTLSNSELTIQVSPHGAELCSIVRNGHEYLWQADPAYWKRYSPVLFPIVGSVWEGRYRVGGQTYEMSQHGFARDMDFELLSQSATELRYRLADTEETRRKYPYPFVLEIGYRLHGACVDVLWQVANPASAEMYFQIGAHPAFNVPGYDEADPRRGFFGFAPSEGLEYVRIAERGCVAPDVHYPMPLADGLLQRPCLRLRFDAPVLGLWSPPGKNAPFVCIEPWYGRCDRAHFSGEFKDRDWVQCLGAGETFRGGYTIELL